MKFLKGDVFPRLVAALPLLFPLYLFRGDFFGVPVTVPELLVGVAFLFFLFRERVWTVGFWSRNWDRWKLYSVWLFVIAAIIGTFIVSGSDERLLALGILKGWIFAPIIYFVMARYYFHEKPGLIKLALRSMLLGGVLLSVDAIYQMITGDFLTPDGRASGPFESANYLALYVGPLAVYSLLAFVREKSFSWRIFLGLSSVLCLVALYATLSYAAWIAVVAAFFVALMVHARNLPKKVRYGLFASVVLVIALAVVSQLGSAKFEQFLQVSERSSTSVRLQVYDIAVWLIKQNPLFGIGLGQFQDQYYLYAETVLGKAPYELNMLHPHNIFLAFWLNMGLLGLISFVWLCVKALPWILEQDKKERRIAAIMLIAIIVHGLFDVPYFKNDLSFQFWLLMAILL